MILRERTNYIVLHTAAFGKDKGEFNAEICTSWHVKRHFVTIGYHYVICNGRGGADGEIQVGRPEDRAGAHVKGINSVSLGICLAGNGDYEKWTEAQKQSLFTLVKDLQSRYNVPTQNVIGHREIGKVNPKYSTRKTCPGRLINMDQVRGWLDKLIPSDSV